MSRKILKLKKIATQELKDNNGHLQGKIVEEAGKLVLKDKFVHSKGKYDPNTNTTHDMNGHKIGSGNLLTTLL